MIEYLVHDNERVRSGCKVSGLQEALTSKEDVDIFFEDLDDIRLITAASRGVALAASAKEKIKA